MREYEHTEGHNRVAFSARDVLNIRPELAALTNTHPTFVAIRVAFEAETVNISTKQAAVLNRSLAAENKPYLSDLAARCPFEISMSSRMTAHAALRSVMSHLECGTYGDWTYSDDFTALPQGFAVLELTAADSPLYLAFNNARDLDTATIALETPGWML
jgi:hypothetical protein